MRKAIGGECHGVNHAHGGDQVIDGEPLEGTEMEANTFMPGCHGLCLCWVGCALDGLDRAIVGVECALEGMGRSCMCGIGYYLDGAGGAMVRSDHAMDGLGCGMGAM